MYKPSIKNNDNAQYTNILTRSSMFSRGKFGGQFLKLNNNYHTIA